MSLNTTDVENPYDDVEYSEEEIANEGEDNNFGEQLDEVFAELVEVVEINRSSSC